MDKTKTYEWMIGGRRMTLFLRDAIEMDVRSSRHRRVLLCAEDKHGRTTSFHAEITMPGNDSLTLSLKVGNDERDIVIWLGNPLVFVSLSLESQAIGVLMRRITRGEDREVSLRVRDRAIWWSVWHPSMSWSSGTPRWRSGSWHPLDTIFGRTKHAIEDVLAAESVEIPMPEGIYKGTARLLLETWKRPRAFWVSHRVRRAHIDVPNGVPFPGKGENSYDCGEDASYGITTPADTIEEGLGHLIAGVLRNRRRYGGRNWRPAPKAEAVAG